MALDNRSLKPYPPAGVEFADTSEPGGTGQVRVTWNNRNRLTSGIKKQPDAGDALEVGQEHTIRVYAHDLTLLHTETGITTELFDYLASDEISEAGGIELLLTFKIKSERDGYESAEIVKRLTDRLFYVKQGSDFVIEGTERVVA